MSAAQTVAKRFLADRVIHQALAEGLPLSEAEREMLLWSESDPELTIDPTLPQRFAAETSDEEFERKIAGLLERSFSTDMHADPTAEARWKEASRVLDQGDHYISIMLDAAVGQRWKSRWQKFLGG
jgi:hypothetical protein